MSHFTSQEHLFLLKSYSQIKIIVKVIYYGYAICFYWGKLTKEYLGTSHILGGTSSISVIICKKKNTSVSSLAFLFILLNLGQTHPKFKNYTSLESPEPQHTYLK